MQKKFSIFHYLLYTKLRQKIRNRNTKIIKYNELKKILNIHKILSSYHQTLFKEMEEVGLIKILNKQSIEVLEIEIKEILDKFNLAKQLYIQGKNDIEVAKELDIKRQSANRLKHKF